MDIYMKTGVNIKYKQLAKTQLTVRLFTTELKVCAKSARGTRENVSK